jgi:DNA helicase HerA-like ATPase
VAQARKYGLGIVVATQGPKNINHNVIANCDTQFFGRANSPAAFEVVGAAISQRGGDPTKISRLKTGQFFICSEAITPPAKIHSPLYLSYHPASPLSEEDVLQRAAIARLSLKPRPVVL